MDISKVKLAWKYLTGGMGGVADYLLDVLNSALISLDPTKKEKIQGVLNLALRVSKTLAALGWLCPTKWQTAYAATLNAVETVIAALVDLAISAEELGSVRNAFAVAVAAWKSEDDATCV